MRPLPHLIPDRRPSICQASLPNVECCSEEKPGWVVYAESRGGSLTVDVNDGAYYFIYRDLPESYEL